jgi:hypothetical protein
MADNDILSKVDALVAEEHELRKGGGPIDQDRLRHIEETLDQCWDLLRQRRGRREFAEDEDFAAVRDVRTVEGYQQ